MKPTKIIKVASFSCGVYQNAIDICIALAKAGRFVNIIKSSEVFIVEIYEKTPDHHRERA